jgi:hypothetical protein
MDAMGVEKCVIANKNMETCATDFYIVHLALYSILVFI